MVIWYFHNSCNWTIFFHWCFLKCYLQVLFFVTHFQCFVFSIETPLPLNLCWWQWYCQKNDAMTGDFIWYKRKTKLLFSSMTWHYYNKNLLKNLFIFFSRFVCFIYLFLASDSFNEHLCRKINLEKCHLIRDRRFELLFRTFLFLE